MWPTACDSLLQALLCADASGLNENLEPARFAAPSAGANWDSASMR